MFSTIGTVTECAIIRNYAFIHYATPEEAKKAIEKLDGTMFMGSKLQIEMSRSHHRGSNRMNYRREIIRTDGSGDGMERRGRDSGYGGYRDRSPAYTGAY
ncbi:hypothetical protein, partial [Salmonella sp. s51228]|uniref:hypothetical protein n=1 Tax=Salmonella sp. s51228 TaxID=3159652 RepID=UPI0039800B2C